MFKVIYKYTNSYPKYTKATEEFKTYDEAFDRYIELGDKFHGMMNNGELQDFEVQVTDR